MIARVSSCHGDVSKARNAFCSLIATCQEDFSIDPHMDLPEKLTPKIQRGSFELQGFFQKPSFSSKPCLFASFHIQRQMRLMKM